MIFRRVREHLFYKINKKTYVVISMLVIYTMWNLRIKKHSTIVKHEDESIKIRFSRNEKQSSWDKEVPKNYKETHIVEEVPQIFTRPINSKIDQMALRAPSSTKEDKVHAPLETTSFIPKDYRKITASNLTIDEINANNYSPVPGAGEHGKPVFMNTSELAKAEKLFDLYDYNLLVGDKISINRSLPDKRRQSCKEIVFNVNKISSASIIIIFHDEAWSTLMRTVMSVIVRSPKELIKEVLLVDDGSQRTYLRRELDEAVATLDKVRILRLPKQRGIVGARLEGARVATATVLVFLDSHVEVTVGWLEPLLERAGNADVYVCPLLDIISTDTFQYKRSNDSYWGGFTWGLDFQWYIPNATVLKQIQEDPTIPVPTPAMSGGLFAVKKELFWRLGGYDDGMNIWGGENLELSWRAWQCGARVEIALCSRVGHLFRYRYNPQVSDNSKTVTLNNKARAAMVWMDEWGEFYLRFNKPPSSVRNDKSITERVKLRKKMKCKSFKWYLDNVWPTHFFPTDTNWFGRIRSNNKDCLGVPYGRNYSIQWRGIPATLLSCGSDFDYMRLLVYTYDNKIINLVGLCLEQIQGRALWKQCVPKHPKQIWIDTGPYIISSDRLYCLSVVRKTTERAQGSVENLDNEKEVMIAIKRCRNTIAPDKYYNYKTDYAQDWYFEHVPWH